MGLNTYKDFVDSANQDRLREELIDYMKKNPNDIIALSKDIGVSYITLNRFLRGSVKARFRVLSTIDKFLKGKK